MAVVFSTIRHIPLATSNSQVNVDLAKIVLVDAEANVYLLEMKRRESLCANAPHAVVVTAVINKLTEAPFIHVELVEAHQQHTDQPDHLCAVSPTVCVHGWSP
jgi:hypothetical protein